MYPFPLLNTTFVFIRKDPKEFIYINALRWVDARRVAMIHFSCESLDLKWDVVSTSIDNLIKTNQQTVFSANWKGSAAGRDTLYLEVKCISKKVV